MTISSEQFDRAAIVEALYGDGIVSLDGAFPKDFADELYADMMALFDEARSTPGGAVPRGPQRWYVEVSPERIGGFVAIVTHPWFVTVCEAVLGPDYRIVELGFDVPLPGAADQPWHRDFKAGDSAERRLSSLAFNITGVDTRPEHGPFEIAPGTQWDSIPGAADGMFPGRSLCGRYVERAVAKLPQRGDISARTGLTIHRGTANRSSEPRPMLIVGVVAPDALDPERHQLQVSRAWLDRLAPELRRRLACRVTEEPEPVPQKHMIGGLLEADYG